MKRTRVNRPLQPLPEDEFQSASPGPSGPRSAGFIKQTEFAPLLSSAKPKPKEKGYPSDTRSGPRSFR